MDRGQNCLSVAFSLFFFFNQKAWAREGKQEERELQEAVEKSGVCLFVWISDRIGRFAKKREGKGWREACATRYEVWLSLALASVLVGTLMNDFSCTHLSEGCLPELSYQ